jgi:hypothetical protein
LRGARRFTDNSRVRIEAATGDPEYPRNPKKSLSAFQIFNKRKIRGDKQAVPAVQNIFKKVKKKLVRILDIQ